VQVSSLGCALVASDGTGPDLEARHPQRGGRRPGKPAKHIDPRPDSFPPAGAPSALDERVVSATGVHLPPGEGPALFPSEGEDGFINRMHGVKMT